MFIIERVIEVKDHKSHYSFTLADETTVLASKRLFGRFGIFKPRVLTVGCIFSADIDGDNWISKIHKIARP